MDTQNSLLNCHGTLRGRGAVTVYRGAPVDRPLVCGACLLTSMVCFKRCFSCCFRKKPDDNDADKSPDSTTAEGPKENCPSPTLGGGIFKYRSRSQATKESSQCDTPGSGSNSASLINKSRETETQDVSFSDSPKGARTAFQRQRRVVFYIGDSSDEDDFARQEGLRIQETGRSKEQRKSEGNCDITIATIPVEGGDANRERDVATSAHNDSVARGFRDLAERALEHPEESPFLPARSPDHASMPETHPGHLSLKDFQEAPLDSKRSPKLEHKAVTQVKSLISIEYHGISRHKNEEHSACSRPSGRVSPMSRRAKRRKVFLERTTVKP
ncbi:hypothetical protein JRQ81_013200 [Phrynocephalus forsythii]|uniref:Uncharacterized protein n=1 Tax=Phrynocephalus forsythii TaxID=171643 RepID=A0A9Q0Y1C9_9SAUR|nr:hypothetical protein JRQ81_013200 [Phrynocephalus forsythii]